MEKQTKTIVLTGGTTGIGAAAAARLLSRGCQVTILDIAEPGNKLASFLPCDLSDIASIDHAISELPTGIDALINVAGVSNAFPDETIMAVNFLGLRYLTESLVTAMADGGSIVNVASSAGHDWRSRRMVVRELLDTPDFNAGLAWLRSHQDEWTDNPYKFSKQCVAAYTYVAAGLAVNRRVRVNCVNPGSTGTQLTPDFRRLVGEELYDWGTRQIGREGKPEDIAEVIEFLAIGECGWLNGTELAVDGGFIAGVVGGWIDLEQSPQ